MIHRDSKIFVTGATGFVGSYILNALIQNGYTNIIALSRNITTYKTLHNIDPKVKWVQGDILDLPLMMEILVDVKCIIHAAASVHFNSKHHHQMIQVATDGTANLVNIALEYNIEKFVHISSVAAIGRSKPIENITESNIFGQSKYNTTYGLSKFLAEQEVWRGHAEGLNTTILNPSLIIGTGDWNQSSIQIFKKIYHGMRFYPEGTTGWVDVRDVAQAALLALDQRHDGERYIISGENISYKLAFQSIAQSISVPPPNRALPIKFGKIIAFLEAVRSALTKSDPIITKETIWSTAATSTYDNSKSKEKLGITYRPISELISTCGAAFLDSYTHNKPSSLLPFD